jgi:hypothetical protein
VATVGPLFFGNLRERQIENGCSPFLTHVKYLNSAFRLSAVKCRQRRHFRVTLEAIGGSGVQNRLYEQSVTPELGPGCHKSRVSTCSLDTL